MQKNRGKQRIGKIRDLFKNIRDTKGTFHEKMGTTKERKFTDLTEAEDIKKRWQEYTKELYKNDLHDPDGVITHLEPDVLECKVKWALGSIAMNKASGGDGAISNPKRWCCESAALNMPANLENPAEDTELQNVSFHSSPKKGNAKECSNCHTIALISHASKVMLKILQARLQL